MNPYVFIVGSTRSGTTLLQRMVEGTQEEPAPAGLISAIARYRDWPVGEFAAESVEMTLLELRLDYPEPAVLAKMPLKRS